MFYGLVGWLSTQYARGYQLKPSCGKQSDTL